MSDDHETIDHRTTIRPASTGERLSEERIHDLIHAVEEGFREKGLESIERLAGSHLLEHSSTLGHVDFRERVEIVRSILEDARLHVDEIVAQGDVIAWRWTIIGTHKGKWMGIAPTGREVSISGISVDRFEHGTVAEHWEFPDALAFARQFEEEPEPTSR